MAAVIVSAVRVPTGKFLGALKSLPAPAARRPGRARSRRPRRIDPAAVDECIMGNVVSAGLGQNPARQAALNAGLDPLSATTINKVCGSGLQAVMLAAQAIAAGDSRSSSPAGMESMSRAPYLLRQERDGRRLGNAELSTA